MDNGSTVGTLISGFGGFYQVALDGDGSQIRCRLRGRLRQTDARPLTGDRVRVGRGLTPGSDGVIEEIFPRRSQLHRPPIANVDQVLIVMACAEPDPDRFFLDRLLVAVYSQSLQAVLCLNKSDLATEQAAREWIEPYRSVVTATFIVSARLGEGIDAVTDVLKGRISTMAGPSGVGKSALLNAINPRFERQTGELSQRLGRGRHTTRAVELLALPGGGWIADTPGFSQIDLSGIPPEMLQNYFPDLVQFAGGCRFTRCSHLQEPDCEVQAAAQQQRVAPWRYAHYCQIMEELRQEQARQYR